MEISRVVRADSFPSCNELSSRLCMTENYESPSELKAGSQSKGKHGIERQKEKAWQSEESINSKQDKVTGNDTASEDSCGFNQVLTAQKTNAVAFHIPAGQAVSRPLPKHLCNRTKRGRENVSLERLTEKQKMAERRKNQHVEQRLKRIHERQEAARKLAHNVEILLQQRSIAGTGQGVSHNRAQMISSDLLATAGRVAKDFSKLTSQMRKDFAFEEKNNNFSQTIPSCAKTRQVEKPKQSYHSTNDNNRSVAFTVGFDDCKQFPVPRTLQFPIKTQKSKLTAQDIEEKQRKAEERRNQKQQDRVKRAIANREALLKLASDLDTFMKWSEDDKTVRHQYQAAQLANEIADSFDRLSQRYTRDLKQAEGFSYSW